MRKISISLCTAIAIGAVAVGSSLVWAADGPHDGAIKARQSVMKLYGFNLGILGAMAKGKMDYNADAANAAAGNMAALVSLNQSAMWPKGSDSENAANMKNRALSAMWENFPKVQEHGNDLANAVLALVPVAGDGLDALKGAMGDVGGSCKGCHDDFRAEKK